MNGSNWRWGVAGTVNNGSGWIGSYCGCWLAGRHTVIFNQRGTGDFLMDGEVMNNVSGAKSSSGKTLMIGCARSNTNNANLTGKIYALTMTDSEGVVKINLIPCAYTEDAVEKVGFYDTVSETYFTCTRTEAKYALTAGNDRKNELKVTGAPFEAASNEDAVEYGTKVGLTEAITLTAPAKVRFSFGGTATCTGYKVYKVDPLTGAKSETATGTETSYTYTPGTQPSVLEWQWDVSFPTLTTGTTYYVSPMGDDANDGLSWAKALRAPQTAIDKASSEGGDVVLVSPGKFYSTENLNGGALSKLTCMRISKAVKVIGIGGADTTIMDASYNRPRNGSYITVDGAFLSGFSITNAAYAGKAQNVGVEMTAGTISNMIFSIRQTWAGQLLNVKGGVGNALAQDIRMGDISKYRTAGEGENVVIIEGTQTYDATVDGFTMRDVMFGANAMNQSIIYVLGNRTGSDYHPGTLRNALIADVTTGNAVNSSRGNLVYLGYNAHLINATIVNNRNHGPNSALRVSTTDHTYVTNCIVKGNVSVQGTYGDIYGNSNVKAVYTTLCDQLEAGVRGNLNGDPGFVDAKNGDYRLTGASQCVNAGGASTDDDSILGMVDVAGNPRVVGGAVDLGAYEHQDPATFAADYTTVVGEGNLVTFTGTVNGSAEGVTATWDFGDGSEVSTDWPTATHTYATPGSYTVTLTVERGGETATRTKEGGAVVVPAVCYVSTNGSNTYPYDTWEKATSDIQAAVDVGSAKVLVGPGTYQMPANATWQSIQLNHAVELASSEGPEATILDADRNVTSVSHRHFDIRHSGVLVHGFTLNGGYVQYNNAQGYNWSASIEMCAGVVSNCLFRNGRQVSRGPYIHIIGTGKMVDCDINGCGIASDNGTSGHGGLYLEGNALVDRCKIYGFSIPGAYDVGISVKGPIMLNSANCEIRNSLIYGCTNASTSAHLNYGGVVQIVNGKLVNCTVVDNYCGGKGAVKFFANSGKATTGSVVNSIVRDNVALLDDGTGGQNDFYAATAGASVSYTCAGSFAGLAGGAGDGCTTANPNFASDGSYQLTSLSAACLGKAQLLDWMADSVDLAHNPRIDVKKGEPDMGCYEFVYSTEPEPLQVTVDIQNGVSREPVVATLTATVVGGGDTHVTAWDFGDGSPIDTTSGDVVTHTYDKPGTYTVKVTVTSGEEKVEVTSDSGAITVVPETCYVSTTGSNTYPYDTWAKAASSVLDALALNPKTVLVDDGVYTVSGEGISIAQDVVLKSRNGAAKTTIKGSQNWTGNDCDSSHIFSLAHAEARIEGFTLADGYTPTQDDAVCGKISAGTIAHCVITNCSPSYRSPALKLDGANSHAEDCVIDLKPGYNGHSSSNADGHYFFSVALLNGATMDRCEIKNARYTNQGGQNASHKGAVHVVGGSVLRNSLIHDCEITQAGRIGIDPANPQGAFYGIRAGAVVVWDSSIVENCTIVNNTVWHDAGLTILPGDAGSAKSYDTYTPMVTNNICWGNVSTNRETQTWKYFDLCDISDVKGEDSYLEEPRVGYCCATNLTEGVNGNLASDPLFKRWQGHTYQLSGESPCINAGAILDWMDDDAKDLLGKPRIHKKYPEGNRPDMGCYESTLSGLIFLLR